MKTFLSELAQIYVTQHSDIIDKICFVFPGKRAGKFFMRALSESIQDTTAGEPTLMPNILTISELTEQLSGKVTDNRIDMLFVLYDEYCRLQPAGQEKPSFDRFRAWGDTILSDFNDVDMYMADAEKLFANLADYKEIQTDYLTDEQKRVIEHYFGPKFTPGKAKSFWLHFQPQNSKRDTKKKFLKIWESLYPLYVNFSKRLKQEGLCYTGQSYRYALERLKACDDIPELLQCQRIVFVGFNALSTVEFSIFSLLRDTKMPDGSPFADFYWDATGPAMQDPHNTANRFVDANRRAFPSIYNLSDSNRALFPSTIEVIGCPSNSIQTKEISAILQNLGNDKEAYYAMAQAKVAVVLPDEGLLMPLLYALPSNIETCNVTMGYPLKMTSVASFMSLVKRMQMRRRVTKGEVNYFYQDVMSVLQHPMATLLLPSEKIASFVSMTIKGRLYLCPSSLLCQTFGDYSTLFQPADKIFATNQDEVKLVNPTTAYIYALMSDICRALKSDCNETKNALIQSNLDYLNAHTYMQSVCQLDETITHRHVETSMAQVFRLVDKLLASEQVAIQGQPLTGLQIMGTLETRGIDFEYVIIPSMNEKVFPRKAHKRSFIPNNLRIAYGIATTYFEESIFAYNFYRLISRAKGVYMLYDTRSEGMRSGDISRYILQLQYLYKPKSLNIRQLTFDTVDSGHTTLSIPKTGKVKELLQHFLEEDIDSENAKTLSASALKNYLHCPLKFYFNTLRRLKTPDKLDEFINPIEQGNLFHETMQDIYDRMPSTQLKNSLGHYLISSDTLRSWIENKKDQIKQIIDHRIDVFEKKQTGVGAKYNISGQDIIMYKNILTKYVNETLKADLALAEKHGHIIYIASEREEKVQYRLPDGRVINMKYIIDRLDELGTENPLLRISDYKTGADEREVDKLEKVFKESTNMAIFQLFLYANLYAIKHNHTGPIRLDLYCTRNLHVNRYDTNVQCEGSPIMDYRILNEQFKTKLNEVLTELLDTDIPFTAKMENKKCEYCDFKRLCQQVH